LRSGREKVTSNNLLFLSESKERKGCSVSRAQAVRALSSGCLPCTLPINETLAFTAQLERNVARSSSKRSATNYFVFCFAGIAWVLDFSIVGCVGLV
jgi:hypothetical protein